MENQLGSKDPWAHRSEGMKCRTCMFFVQKGSSTIGRCRRHSPTMSGYPVVFDNDWCGDHKLDEKFHTHEDFAKSLCSGVNALNILRGKDIPCGYAAMGAPPEGKPVTQIKE